ncbi:MAG: VCBS repeat-containing protein [Pirellulaceae bacterium]|nr:VCBS repeat-containing protein [Pirellulaceae bacterium]
MRLILVATIVGWIGAIASAAEIDFRDQELPTKLGVGYAVRLIDFNGDKRLDIAIVDQERVLWLENPNWTEHVILQGQTKKDNVCFALHDIDGDGRVDLALGADWAPFNTTSGGTIQWLQSGTDPRGPFKLHPIGEEPTVHRMNFADLDGDGKQELIVAPLMGRDTTKPSFSEHGVRILAYPVPADPVKGPWTPQVLNDDAHVTHNFQVIDVNRDGQPEILLVSFEGVSLLERQKDGKWTRTRIGTGNQETAPNKGASEIKLGHLAGKQDYIATIEPWHGHQVVVYTRPAGERPSTGEWLWKRHLLDEELKWGHAIQCVNLDGDEDEELVIGIRDNLSDQFKSGVRIYDPQDAAAGKWSRQIVDPGSVAIEDMAAGDLNGDGRTDLVAVGRATHNVKIYWNEGEKK